MKISLTSSPMSGAASATVGMLSASTQCAASAVSHPHRLQLRATNRKMSVTTMEKLPKLMAALAFCASLSILRAAECAPHDGVARIPSGRYAPLFRAETDPKENSVEAFL